MSAFGELWAGIRSFNDRYFPGWEGILPVYYSNALAGEVGEVCSVVKKMAGGGSRGNAKNVEDLKEELADVFIYLCLFSQALDMTDDEFIETVMDKVMKNARRMEARGVNEELARKFQGEV